MDHRSEALRMIDTFISVGAKRFYVTKTDVVESKTMAWPATAERLRETLPAILRASAVRKPHQCRAKDGSVIIAGDNVIVRPMSDITTFIQLDDLSGAMLDRVRPAAFLIIATSPGNHQAWIAVSDLRGRPDVERKDFVRRVKKGIGDKSASGAVRLAGTENFKIKYHPDFPTVSILESTPGRRVTAEQLESLGLVSPPEPPQETLIPFRASRRGRPETWPSYERTLARAPEARNHRGRDRSAADFTWCMTAIDWGFDVEATANRLLQESDKAREKGTDYALQTARNAYGEVLKNRSGQGRRRS